MVLPIGTPAPAVEAPDQDGRKVSLKDFRGRKLVLYFYPKDDTPGCTAEACSFSEDMKKLEEAGAKVVGVSVDTIESHKKFAQKYGLDFTLLADVSKDISKRYDVLGERGNATRVTYIIDGSGIIRHVFPSVKPQGHSQEVLRKLSEI